MRLALAFFAAVAIFAISACEHEPEKHQIRYEWRQGTIVEKWEARAWAPGGKEKRATFAKLEVWGEEGNEVVIEDIYFRGMLMEVGECRKFYAEIREYGKEKEIRPSPRDLELCYQGYCSGGVVDL